MFYRSVRKIANIYISLSSHFCTQSTSSELSNLRVIGLLAHVDAGKTTTTERLLYLSGKIDYCGDVNRGNTVTDFQDLEIKRGITINSATVSFPWKDCKINLIDTPGHLDFSIEVQAALTLIQGGVIILDGTAGVEAQTSRLWVQMDKHDVPRLAYINKCDRPTADFNASVNSIQSHFGVQVLPIVIPFKGSDDSSILVNILSQEEISVANGMEVRRQLSNSRQFYDTCCEARLQLIDSISSLDNLSAEKVLKYEKLDVFSVEELKAAIRRVTVAQMAVPVLAGSSIMGYGVTDLLDSIVDYLPNPKESKVNEIVQNLGNYFFGRVFKVFRSPHKGMVAFVYVLNGKLKKGDSIINATGKSTQVVKSMAEPFADEFEEKSSASSGEIVAVYGLKECSLGDLLCASRKALEYAENNLMKQLGLTKSQCLETLRGNIHIPAPVIHSYVELTSQTEQLTLDQALEDIQMEDPSIRITKEDHEIVVGGQGKLHLEVFQDKLKSNYDLEVKLSKPRITFCEILKKDVLNFHCLQKSNVGRDKVEVEFSLLKSDVFSNEIIYDDHTIINLSLPRMIKSFEAGIQMALSRGPNLHLPMCQTKVVIHSLNLTKCRSQPFASASASASIKKAVAETVCGLAEPLMDLNIIVDCSAKDVVQVIKGDLNARGAVLVSDVDKGSRLEVQAVVPLRNLDDYFSHLLSITSGRASLSMKYARHSPMLANDEQNVLDCLTV